MGSRTDICHLGTVKYVELTAQCPEQRLAVSSSYVASSMDLEQRKQTRFGSQLMSYGDGAVGSAGADTESSDQGLWTI